MRNPAESFMNQRHPARIRAALLTAMWTMTTAATVFAQDDSAPHSAEVANPMGIHTWFVIVIVGAFLAWSISYSLQMQKEALRKRSSREGLLLLKNQYLDQLADLESRRQAGKISEQRYKREYNNGRLRLAKVLEKIEETRDAQS